MADALKGLITEFWVEYAVGNVFLLLRFYARIKILGITNLQLDDYFAFAGFVRQPLFCNPMVSTIWSSCQPH